MALTYTMIFISHLITSGVGITINNVFAVYFKEINQIKIHFQSNKFKFKF